MKAFWWPCKSLLYWVSTLKVAAYFTGDKENDGIEPSEMRIVSFNISSNYCKKLCFQTCYFLVFFFTSFIALENLPRGPHVFVTIRHVSHQIMYPTSGNPPSWVPTTRPHLAKLTSSKINSFYWEIYRIRHIARTSPLLITIYAGPWAKKLAPKVSRIKTKILFWGIR